MRLGAKHAASRVPKDRNSNSKALSVFRRIPQEQKGLSTGPRIPDEAGRRPFCCLQYRDRCLSRCYGPARLVGAGSLFGPGPSDNESEASSQARPSTGIVIISHVTRLPPCDAYEKFLSCYHLFGWFSR